MYRDKKMHPRIHLIIAGTVGVLIAIVTMVRIAVPTLSLLGQFSQFSPLGRVTIVGRLLSPLLTFLLVGEWSWVLLWLGERLIPGGSKKDTDSVAHLRITNPQKHQPHYRLERSVTPQEGITRERWEARRQAAAPPLFQLDPTIPWQSAHLPVMPFPSNLDWSSAGADQETEEETEREETDGEECAVETQAEEILHTQVVDASSPQGENETPPASEPARHTFSLHAPEHSQMPPPVTLTLLKQMQVWVRADDGTPQEVKLRGGENAIRLIQLAYIAWRKGASVDRDKMLTYVLSRGKRRDMTTDQLGEIFDAAKRYLRQDLGRAIQALEKNGHPLTEEVDFFSNEPGFYRLHSSCRVLDLEMIDELHCSIQAARKEGLLDEKLNGLIPQWVVEACQKLMAAYPGDFLQSLLEDFPEEFGPWVKEPITRYRDAYLDAFLILANYESALGKHYLDEALSAEHNEERRRHHTGRAAQLFYDYAMYALNNRWDQKLKFVYRAGKDGERVVRSERALRRCVVELGKLGNPDMIDQVYLTFKERMSTLSEGNWKPDQITEKDVTEAKRTTSAYRFSLQVPLNQDRSK